MEAASALEPGLTATDRRVLAAVPTGATEPACGITGIIAKALRPDARTPARMTREEVIATVRGLEHLGYVAYAKGVYWRTAKGAAALD